MCAIGLFKSDSGTHACSFCTSGTYMINEVIDLLQREPPHIASVAANWNTSTGRFDSMCGGRICAGNTGGHTEGKLNAESGAISPLAFVGSDMFSTIEWGAESISAMFTICSITRYAGFTRRKILGCVEQNWLHGHYDGNARSTFYTSVGSGNLSYSITAVNNWVAVCGRNLVSADSIGTVVNGVATSFATGGVGGCTLSMSGTANENSVWALSKLYIWDHHLSDTDFALASSGSGCR